jgi:hypothetical protein
MKNVYPITHLEFPAGGGGRFLLALISSMFYEHPVYDIGYAGDAHNMLHNTNLDSSLCHTIPENKAKYKFYWWHKADSSVIKNCNYIRMIVHKNDINQIIYLRIVKNFIGESFNYYSGLKNLKLQQKIIRLSSNPRHILLCHDINEVYNSFIKIGRKVSKHISRLFPNVKDTPRYKIWEIVRSAPKPLPHNTWLFEKTWHQYRAWKIILSHSKNIPLGMREMVKDHLDHIKENAAAHGAPILKKFSDTNFDPIQHASNNTLPIYFRNIMTNPRVTIETLEKFYNKPLPLPSINYYTHYLKYNEEFAKLFFPALDWNSGRMNDPL